MPANGSGGRQRRETDTGGTGQVVVMAEEYTGPAPGDEETSVQDEFIKAQERDAKPKIEFHETGPFPRMEDNEFELDKLTLQPRRIKRPDTPLVLDEPEAAASDVELADFLRDEPKPPGDDAPFHARQNRGGVATGGPFPLDALLVILAAAAGSAFVVYWYLFG